MHHRHARQMHDRGASGKVGLWHIERRIVGERADQSARERRLAGAESAGERQKIARPQHRGDVLGEPRRRLLVGKA